MQTIIATVGTSLLTNRDNEVTTPRPWAGGNYLPEIEEALDWMRSAELEIICAETNTLYRLSLATEDAIHLLHSDTEKGKFCAELLKQYLTTVLGQQQVALHALPGVSYELDEDGSSLQRMSQLVETIIASAEATYITLAATGGFKAESMMLAIIGQAFQLPVCYLHEQFKGLIYLPYYQHARDIEPLTGGKVSLPDSGIPRDQVSDLTGDPHHGSAKFKPFVTKLTLLPWVEKIRYLEQAKHAPKNGLKPAPRGSGDDRHVFWLHLVDNKDNPLYLRLETTGHTPEQQEEASRVLRELLGGR